MSSCCETFEMRGLSGISLQNFVFYNHGKWDCEKCQCGSNSPGPVEEDEALVFLLINPTHFDKETGELHPIAFQEIHNRDLSVIREKHADQQEIEATRDAVLRNDMLRVPPKLRKIEYVAVASAQDIRKESDDVDRLFAVYDTPIDGRPSHASVFTRPDVLANRGLKMVARNRLHAVFAGDIRPL